MLLGESAREDGLGVEGYLGLEPGEGGEQYSTVQYSTVQYLARVENTALSCWRLLAEAGLPAARLVTIEWMEVTAPSHRSDTPDHSAPKNLKSVKSSVTLSTYLAP